MDLLVQETFFRFRLKQLGLSSVWDWVTANNPTGGLPYHNNQHLFHVARIANQLQRLEDPDLSRDDEVMLILACLFHDFDHSGGETDDKENIQRAIAGLEWFAGSGIAQEVLHDPHMFYDIAALIRVTEFPFVHTPTTVMGKCLRDADVLYSFSSVGVKYVVSGLRQEMAVSTGTLLRPLEFIEKQKLFINGLELFTEAGRYLWRQTKVIVLDEQIRYIKQTYGVVTT